MKVIYSTLLLSALACVLVTAVPIRGRDTTDLQLNARNTVNDVDVITDFYYRDLDEDERLDERDSVGSSVKHGFHKSDEYQRFMRADEMVAARGELALRDVSSQIKGSARKAGSAVKQSARAAGHAVKSCVKKLGQMACARDVEEDVYELVLREDESDEEVLGMRESGSGGLEERHWLLFQPLLQE
ncbi:hypothetical protein CALCODRAFT_487825 [Calocera cornea HHB12733]|uniref:Uncharacterized protein n=1 Tax=Calocera cornea HHB12733 TaxID=1353952 RepID=A0A165CWN4_9BASI|nr:hypothetical protein CALCODRAFT_487825 [Calocera cornea HHB12733]